MNLSNWSDPVDVAIAFVIACLGLALLAAVVCAVITTFTYGCAS